jgi:hypothetical protein
MHLGLQTMAYRHYMPGKNSGEMTNRSWDVLAGTLPGQSAFDDVPGGADLGAQAVWRHYGAHAPMFIRRWCPGVPSATVEKCRGNADERRRFPFSGKSYGYIMLGSPRSMRRMGRSADASVVFQ